MKSTADRYREAGMPPPKGEAYIPLHSERARRLLVRTQERLVAQPQGSPLDERVHDPAADGPVLPEIDPAAYGSDSVPLDTPDVINTEETS